MISTIIPAYNASATIGETVGSILSQTRPPDEIVLIDDGSTDGTSGHDVLRDDRVRIVRQENHGVSKALNRGLEEARGDLLTFIDADDLWPAGKIERQLRSMETEDGPDAVFGHVTQFACPTSTAAERERWIVQEEPQPGWLLGTLMIRSKAAHRVGAFEESLAVGGSVDWLARLRDSETDIRMLDDVFLLRRIHGGSLSQRSRDRDASYLLTVRRALQRKRAAVESRRDTAD